ncbi:MAG: ABC transporter ATP-binding protein [Burkholderiales bacterium]|nr:MAG: ABC transporter ATP-binding protein [Burkholderiales bacterium]
MPVLAINQLKVALPAGGDRSYAIENISLSIEAGKTLCVVGESGSGKSVMATAVMGLLAKELKVGSGSIALNGDNLLTATPQKLRSLRGKAMGMVFQEPMTALNPVMRCGDQIDELLKTHTDWSSAKRQEEVLKILERVKLPEPQRMMRSYPHQLSGGQRQRIVIAMACILKPALLICDEPTTALDVTTQKEILRLIDELQREQGCAVLFITHDMGVVAEIADDVLVMNQGQAMELGSADQVLKHPQQAYTQMLLAAVPSMQPPAPKPDPVGEPLLKAHQVGKTYISRDWLGRARLTQALQDAALELRAGETVGIVGESGSGKSTLARCIMRLIDPTVGDIYWGHENIATKPESALRPLRSHIQVVFQDPNRSLNPRRKIVDSLCEGAMNFGASRADSMPAVAQILQKVKLPPEAMERYPSQFSGGQRQRLAIARALMCKPQVLVADEAVSALDVSVQAQILNLLREVQAELGLGLLFITHDLRVAAQLCDRVIVMHQGRIVEQGKTAELYANPQQDYTKRLFDAAPKNI